MNNEKEVFIDENGLAFEVENNPEFNNGKGVDEDE